MSEIEPQTFGMGRGADAVECLDLILDLLYDAGQPKMKEILGLGITIQQHCECGQTMNYPLHDNQYTLQMKAQDLLGPEKTK